MMSLYVYKQASLLAHIQTRTQNLSCSVYCIISIWWHLVSQHWKEVGGWGFFLPPFEKQVFQQYLWMRRILEIIRKQWPSQQRKRLRIVGDGGRRH